MAHDDEAVRGDPAPDARRSALDYVTAQVMELIRGEDLEPGDRLPTVQLMARRFQVAQPTMRESLRRLQAVGIVDIRHGSGVYVKRHGHAVVLPNPHPGALSRRTILDLFEARLLIEPALAHRAAERASAADLAELGGTLEQAGSCLHSGDSVLGRLNLDFHVKVSRLSGNTVLAQVIESLADVYRDEQLLVMRVYDDRDHDHQAHLGILAALERRSPSLAERRMRAHLKDVQDVLAQRTADSPGPPEGGLTTVSHKERS